MALLSRPARALVFVPTYNERENVEKLLSEILALGLGLDLLFLDDNSPDGTGKLLDELAAKHKEVRVIHRSGKLGIGSAHQAGIAWAYEHGYSTLITMDCDFTHPTQYIADFLKAGETRDVVVGSRYLRSDSLDDWDLFRLVLTRAGHYVTKYFLGLPYDATGAYRLYRLDRVPRAAFSKVHSRGYSFFFESLFVLHVNGLSIGEVGITLPARTKGHSKMTVADAWKSVRQVFALRAEWLASAKRFLLTPAEKKAAASFNSSQWNANSVVLIESGLAQRHRDLMLRLTRFKSLVQDRSAKILDLGCGSGPFLRYFHGQGYRSLHGIEPDAELIKNIPAELRAVVKNCVAEKIAFGDGYFDVVFVYCVLHHLKGAESYRAACAEIGRILKPGGLLFIVEPGRYKLFRAIEVAAKALGLVSKTFKAFSDTMIEEAPEQHFFLKNHGIVRDELLARGLTPIVDDYFFYSWIFTAQKA